MDHQKSTISKIIRISFIFIFIGFVAVVDAATTVIQPVSITAIVPGVSNSVTPSNSIGGGSSTVSFGGIVSQSIIFKGVAYPGSIVTLFKNGSLVAEQSATIDSTFEIGINSLPSGTYVFSLRTQDDTGRRSTLTTYTINLTSGVTTLVKGIVIAPTVSIDKKEVRRGDQLTIFGKSIQNAEVTLIFNSEKEIVKKTKADSNGNWMYKFDTLEFGYGEYQVKVRAATSTGTAPFSESLSFIVGQKNVVSDADGAFVIYDVSRDSQVDLIDFNLLVYWFRKPNPPAAVDMNADGIVSLADFSLFIYHWTG